jgi:hypothetical protein
VIFRRSPGPEHPIAVKAAKRLDRVPTAEALLWADNAGSTLARSLSDFQRDRDPAHLDDVEQAALMLLGCVDSLRRRSA